MTQPPAPDTRFFGHPRGLSTLFFTEMWERFSYYGTRALLIYFMTASAADGGLGFGVAKASAIYGMYTAMVYMLSLPGGWIADRFLGQRKAVFLGGILIALGNLGLAIHSLATFYAGLGLVVLGTGLLKPNVSAIVGQIYPAGDQRRDAGFSIFYMGINLGAFLAPLICGYFGQNVNWHIGFGVAAVGMTCGLIQYKLGGHHLGDAGLHPVKAATPEEEARQRTLLWVGLGGGGAFVALAIILKVTGILPISAAAVSQAFGMILLLTVIVSFAWLLLFTEWSPEERKRLIAIFGLFLASTVFWSVFEQAGSTLSLFAQRNTNNVVLGFSYPPSWFQSMNSIFIFSFAPVFAWIWLRLGSRDPSSPTKFTIGLLLVGLGFAVLVPAAAASAEGALVSPLWLTVTYLCHTFGELCLSPVGLSAMTKLAPVRIAGLTMGIWFLSISVGNYLGGRASALYESLPLPTLFGAVAGFAIAAAVVLAVLIRPINKLMGGVK
jgi:POT family proton-dependent oligopeptide transporter